MPLAPRPLQGSTSEPYLNLVRNKLKGGHLSSFFCVEVFAGSARLTATLRAIGLSDSIAVDHQIPKRLIAPMLQLDLTKEASVEHLRSILREPRCLFCHFAPPCGTASRARLIQRSAMDPPILRTDSFPDGLPELSGQLKARVQAENNLYAVTADLAETCLQAGVLLCIENPARGFLWQTSAMSAFGQRPELTSTLFHQCEYGSSRKEARKFLHTVPNLLLRQCSNTHEHETLGRSASGGRTTDEETA